MSRSIVGAVAAGVAVDVDSDAAAPEVPVGGAGSAAIEASDGVGRMPGVGWGTEAGLSVMSVSISAVFFPPGMEGWDRD